MGLSKSGLPRPLLDSLKGGLNIGILLYIYNLMGTMILIFLTLVYKFRRHIASCLSRDSKQENQNYVEPRGASILTIRTNTETSKPDDSVAEVQKDS